ncbi:MAG: hypothetical protein PVG93_07045 [Phycisphaerales bacterium]
MPTTMDVTTLKDFFLWCTIINFAILILSFLMCICLKDWIYSIHSKMFSISRDAFNVGIWSFIAVYKMFVIVFNLVPFIALAIVG